ncbi:hypothetical protein COU57_05150 [Candidatus Pacearchaeota archaeon CG10_big_fil_rev_8_21_14_0_10_32_14]|nr:MAG: hypothetical protein COU57_05150 [Candidatus Pacearchaeota archaeon CG10_big_fil_rev_8_21_14_0_10_32_14]
MVFKINISSSDGKTYKFELDNEGLEGMKLGEKLEGKEILPALDGYEFIIAGASDISGFPALKFAEGVGLSKHLLSFEKGMRKRPKYLGKRKRSLNKPKGLRLRKSVRGNTLSSATTQINLKTIKVGPKKLSEVFEAQNKEKTPKPNRASKRHDKKNAPKAE